MSGHHSLLERRTDDCEGRMSGHIAPKRRPAMTRIALCAILILGVFVWTWGALNADLGSIYGCGNPMTTIAKTLRLPVFSHSCHRFGLKRLS